MEIAFTIIFLVFGIISLLWANGIDKMLNEHPDYKGEDLFGEDKAPKEITPEMIWNDEKKEGIGRLIKAHKAIEVNAEVYAKSTFKWPKNKQGEDQTIPAGQSVPHGYRKHIKLMKKPFMDGVLSETAKNYWYEHFRNENKTN